MNDDEGAPVMQHDDEGAPVMQNDDEGGHLSCRMMRGHLS